MIFFKWILFNIHKPHLLSAKHTYKLSPESICLLQHCNQRNDDSTTSMVMTLITSMTSMTSMTLMTSPPHIMMTWWHKSSQTFDRMLFLFMIKLLEDMWISYYNVCAIYWIVRAVDDVWQHPGGLSSLLPLDLLMGHSSDSSSSFCCPAAPLHRDHPE